MLTEAQRNRIKHLRQRGASIRQLACAYGVPQEVIRQVLSAHPQQGK